MADIVYDLSNQTRIAPEKPVSLPESRRAGRDSPKEYIPEPGLVDAFRAALLLRRPLLLTGEPGTGKTQAAHYLNWKLGYGEKALRFDAKSTSGARDLFYTYNTIGRFHAAQTKEGSQNSVDYIHYNALGEAILRAMSGADVARWLPPGFSHPGEPVQSVVLIDEVDKAPRDFPNDVLNEIENLVFRVPELGNKEFKAEAKYQPVVIITSNSEKNLPAAFLRRCVYYHIQKPDKARFALILQARLGVDTGSRLMEDALEFLTYARSSEAELNKKPATAELLDFVLLLQARGAEPRQSFRDIRNTVISALNTLVKDEGLESARVLDAWLNREDGDARDSTASN
jgi:MoxR-like ATPase